MRRLPRPPPPAPRPLAAGASLTAVAASASAGGLTALDLAGFLAIGGPESKRYPNKIPDKAGIESQERGTCGSCQVDTPDPTRPWWPIRGSVAGIRRRRRSRFGSPVDRGYRWKPLVGEGLRALGGCAPF